jgi:hypothetical protein
MELLHNPGQEILSEKTGPLGPVFSGKAHID